MYLYGYTPAASVDKVSMGAELGHTGAHDGREQQVPRVLLSSLPLHGLSIA